MTSSSAVIIWALDSTVAPVLGVILSSLDTWYSKTSPADTVADFFYKKQDIIIILHQTSENNEFQISLMIYYS